MSSPEDMQWSKLNSDDVKDFVKSSLDSERWKHTLGVAECAKTLLTHYNEIPDEFLIIAAYLHDNAKNMDSKDQLALARRYRENTQPEGMDELEEKIEPIWHAPAAAQRAHVHFNLDPKHPVLGAISFHPTGKSPLGPLLKGLLIADFSEPGRIFSQAKYLRKQIGKQSLDQLTIRVLRYKIEHCLQKKSLLHHWTMEAYNTLCD